MTTRIVVMPTGPKATPESIAEWIAAAQRLADERHAEVELNAYAADGVTVTASVIATPSEDDRDAFDDTLMAQECSLLLDDDTICDLPNGHDGLHGSAAVAFREAEERTFLARKHDGKRPYESKAEAKRIAAMTTTTFGGRAKMAYRCPVCDSWHVGVRR